MLIVTAAHGCGIGGLGPYGNEWIATPNLDRLAAEGEVFDRHFSACPCPAVTRREWWANLPAGAVLIRNTRPTHDAPAEVYAPFAEVIDARPDPADPSPADGLLRALTGALDRHPPLLWIETDRMLLPWTIAQDVFEVYLEELTEDDPDAEAEGIAPWANPEVGWFDADDLASWELLHRTHAAAVTGFDADLGRVFELLRERGLADTATWAFTSDFGFPLGEHGLLGPHRPHLHDEFVHLPLIVRRPGGTTAGRRVSRFTQPADVLPLLLGQPIPERESVVTRWAVNGFEEAALRTDRFALLLPLGGDSEDEPRSPLLFEKPDDRHEVNDNRQAHFDLAEEMAAELRGRLGVSSSS